MSSALSGYQSSLALKFTVNAPTADAPDGDYDTATDADVFATYIVYIFPMMLMMFMFAGCMSIAPESISGEKERGTLGTILVTPARRSDLALAKIFSITLFGILSMIGSFVGLMLSLPNMLQADGMDMSLDFYTAGDYALIFLVLLTTALVFVSMLSILSAYAKSVKEANAYAMPLYFITIVCGLSGMVTGGAPKDAVYYLIPIFNSAQSLTAIFKFDIDMVNIAVTLAVNVVFLLVCAFALTKMFDSERIVFEK
jgi:sodium transport system permease protein